MGVRSKVEQSSILGYLPKLEIADMFSHKKKVNECLSRFVHCLSYQLQQHVGAVLALPPLHLCNYELWLMCINTYIRALLAQ